MTNKTYILYHAGCADGFGAAFVVWLTGGENATYIPVSHGKPVPELEDWSEVYILDFCDPREELLKLASRMTRVVVLDHHATAKAGLLSARDSLAAAVYDAEHSGAVIAWNYFQGHIG